MSNTDKRQFNMLTGEYVPDSVAPMPALSVTSGPAEIRTVKAALECYRAHLMTCINMAEQKYYRARQFEIRDMLANLREVERVLERWGHAPP